MPIAHNFSLEAKYRQEHGVVRSEEHTSELQSLRHLVCRLLLEKKNTHQRDLMIDGLGVSAQEHRSHPTILLGELHAETISIEREHSLQNPHVDAAVAQARDERA